MIHTACVLLQLVISEHVTEVWPSVQVHLLGDNEYTASGNKITCTVPNEFCFNYFMLPTVEKVEQHIFLTKRMYIIRLQ